MFQYKFAPPQLKDINQTGATATFGLKSSQSLSSRHIESRIFCSPTRLRHTPDVIGSNSLASGTETSFRLTDEPTDADITLVSNTVASSSLPSTDFLKKFVKEEIQEPDLKYSVGEISPENLFGPVAARYTQLQKAWTEQRNYITDLESRLSAKDEENTMLAKNLSRMEIAHKQATDKHRDALCRAAKNYSGLKSDLDDLKHSTRSSSLIISEAKSFMVSLAALRDSTQIRLRDLESMLDVEGQLILTSETRETVHELRSALLKTQQVADLLRDKLHTMGSDLAEARARILELEELTTADRNRSESTTLKIRQTADQVAEVTRYLREQKHESIQATAKTYEMEQQLAQAQTQLQEAQSVINSMKEEIAAREEFHEERGAELRTLRHTIDFQEGNVKTVEARARRAEEELVQALNHNHELLGRLDSAKSLEKNLTQQASRLLLERDEAKEKMQSTERQLAEVQACEKSLSSDMAKALVERNALVDKLRLFDDVKREAGIYREKYAESQASLKLLQEQFDDQRVTLAASKESIAELQENLHAAERREAATSVESRCEIAHLQEQNGVLKTKLDGADKEIEAKIASFQALQIELSRKEGGFETLLETERLGKNEALSQAQEVKTKVESLLMELAQKDLHLENMAKRLAAAEAPSAEREREVTALQERIAELEATEKQLADRALTISRRYENNDLNDDEKALVALLMQKARAIHDREMVEKANEIKRRDNIIKQHEARIVQLENVLTRRIHDEAGESRLGASVDPNTQNQSWSAPGTNEQGNLIDVGATKPQGLSSDPRPEIRGARHENHPAKATCTTVDGLSVNPSTPRPSSRSAGYSTFARLCREDTDDIADFEDEHPPVATGKRVLFADQVEDVSSSASPRPVRRVKYGKGAGAEKSVVSQQPVVPAPGTGTGTGTATGTGSKKKAPRRR